MMGDKGETDMEKGTKIAVVFFYHRKENNAGSKLPEGITFPCCVPNALDHSLVENRHKIDICGRNKAL